MEPISREEAQKAGLPTYFTNIPCKNGHLLPRNVKSGGCTRCDIEKQRRHYRRNREKMLASAKRWRTENREAWLASAAKSYRKRYAKTGAINRTFRQSVAQDQNFECAVCKASLEENFELDHIVAVSRGGPTVRANLWALCKPCNLAKSRKPLGEWLAERQAVT